MKLTAAACMLFALTFMAAVSMVTSGADVYADLSKIHGLLRTADDRIVQLSRKNCQTGRASVEFCPFTANASFVDSLKCLATSLLNGGDSRVAVVYFDKAFVTRPSVAILNSGISWAFGAFYNITVQKVTSRSLTVQVTTIYSPGAVHFNYVACDRDILFPKAYLDIQEEIAFYNE